MYEIDADGMLMNGCFSWERKPRTDYRRKVYNKFVSEYECPENVNRSGW